MQASKSKWVESEINGGNKIKSKKHYICNADILRGKPKKYVTEEEKLNVKRTRAKKYYWDNKQDQDEKQRKRDAAKYKNRNI